MTFSFSFTALHLSPLAEECCRPWGTGALSPLLVAGLHAENGAEASRWVSMQPSAGFQWLHMLLHAWSRATGSCMGNPNDGKRENHMSVSGSCKDHCPTVCLGWHRWGLCAALHM